MVGLFSACVIASAQASDLQWRTQLETGGATRPFPHPIAQATEDGGFEVSGRTSGGEWLARFDAEGRLLERRRVTRAGARGANVLGAESLSSFTRYNARIPVEWQCQVERTPGGLLRMHLGTAAAGPHGHASVDGLREPSAPLTPPLYWLGRDCRVSPMPDTGAERILQLHHDPVREGVFAVLGSADFTATELVYLDRHVVHWRRALADPAYVVHTDAVGILQNEHSATGKPALLRILRDGRVAWRVEDAAFLAVLPGAIAVLRDVGGAQTGATLSTLGPDGRERSRTRIAEAFASVRLLGYHAAGNDLVLAVTAPEAPSEGSVVAIDLARGTVDARIPLGSLEEPRALLRDGAILAEKVGLYFVHERYLLRTPTTSREIATSDFLPAHVSPVALRPTRDGAILVASRTLLHRVEHDGRVAWQVPAPRSQRRVELAGEVCGVETDVRHRASLDCRSVSTGARRVVSFDFGPFLATAVGDGGHVHFSGRVATGWRFATVTAAGEVVAVRDVPIEGFAWSVGSSPIGDVHLDLENGQTVAYDRAGTRRWALDVATLGGDPGEVLGTGDGGAVVRFAYEGTRKPGIARLEPDGRVRWRSETASHTAQLDAVGEDWLLSTEEAGIERRADRDGALIWRSETAAGFRVVVAVAPDARSFAAGPCCPQSSSFGRYAGDVWWHDAATGARLGAVASADAPSDAYDAVPKFAFDESGRLIRVHSELDAASGRLVVERHALRTVPGASLARTHARGLWRASGLEGHALQVSVDPRGNVDGRWFTFSLVRANDPREQRWFRLTGSARGERLELAIEEASDAAFAGGDAGYRRVGTAQWRQLECGRAEIDYRFAGTLGDVSGRMILERADGATCSDDVRVAAAPEVELWHDTSGAGRALALAVDRSGTGAAFGLWPTWAPTADRRAGEPQWLTLAIDARGDVEIHRTLRGRFEDGPTSNTWRVGRGRFVSHGCDRATLEFAFDDDEIAEPFRAQRGTLALDRRGACR